MCYHTFGFFKVLKFCKWLIFSFFTILFSQKDLPKAQAPQWVNCIVGFFKRLNSRMINICEIRGIYVPRKYQLYGIYGGPIGHAVCL